MRKAEKVRTRVLSLRQHDDSTNFLRHLPFNWAFATQPSGKVRGMSGYGTRSIERRKLSARPVRMNQVPTRRF
jgi:hypothetical protein